MKYILVAILLLFASCGSRAQSPGVDSNTVALWHFDEGTGNILHDASPYHNDGVIHNADWVPGKFGSALHFNGQTSYVSLPNSISLSPTKEFTLEVWFSLDTLNFDPPPSWDDSYACILGNLGPYPYGGGYLIYIRNHQGFQTNYRSPDDGSNFTSFIPITQTHRFYSAVVTYQRIANDSLTLIKTYIDDVLLDSVVQSPPIQYTSTDNFYIGTCINGRALGGPGVREFPGIIDEIRISNIARVPGDFGSGNIILDRSVLDFGFVNMGSSLTENLNISNTMFSQTIHVDSIVSSNSHFIASPSSFSLSPVSSQAVSVTYTPTAGQTDTGILSIYSGGSATAGNIIHLTGTGFVLGLAPIISSIKDVPDDDGKQVRVVWYKSTTDEPSAGDPASMYSIWRRDDDPGQNAGKNYPGLSFRSGIPKQVMINDTLWDFIVTVPAVQFDKYSYVAPTLRNANPTTFNWATFRVAVHTAGGSFYFSAPDSGYSLDNIIPPPPTALAAQFAAGRIALGWSAPAAPDLDHYNVYRSTAPTVVPSVFLRVAAVQTNAFVDSQVVKDSTYYYTVTSVDSSGNESVQSNNTPPLFVTNVPGGSVEIPKTFVLMQNYPNPFNPTTRISYGVPVQSRVTVTVFDVLGREVATLVNGELRGPGMYDVRWNPSVSSGVYFYRIRATAVNNHNTFTDTRKMMLLK